MNQWVNHTRVGLYASAVMPALLLVPLRFAGDSITANTLTTVLWILIGVMPVFGFFTSYALTLLREHWIHKAVR